MAKTHSSNTQVRASVRKAFRDNNPELDRAHRASRAAPRAAVRTPTSRLMKGNVVVMAKTNEEAENDLSIDIAETVGKTVGNIVNRIEALDAEKAQLLKKLSDTRESLNSQFNKWLPASISAGAQAIKGRGKRETRPGTPCSICNFATNPPHDGRLKAHRDQGKNKRALTDSQLDASGLRRA